MLEILGNAIISLVEKQLIGAAPELEKMMLEQLENLVNMLAEFLGLKAQALGASKQDALESPQEHE